MPDQISERITDFIKTQFVGQTLLGKAITIERERLTLNINGHYPYLQLCGPLSEKEPRTPYVSDCALHFAIKVYFSLNDESDTANTELVYQTRNVNADIIKRILIDQSCGGLSQKITVSDDGYN